VKARIIVIGGGPAGLMAAGRAAEVGAGRAEVSLFEKMPRAGTKLRLTGNGRCNLSNDCDVRQFLAHLSSTGPFLRNSLARFSVHDLRLFLLEWGVPTRCEADGRVFPTSDNAGDVLAALERYAREQGVALHCSAPVNEILVEALPGGAGQGKRVSGVCLRDGTIVAAQAVILATGGLSYPTTGSNGDGYQWARKLGHTIVPLRPGLVPLVTRDDFVPMLQGVSVRNVDGTLWQGERMLAHARGDILFTHYGVSGPLILRLSLRLADALVDGPLSLRLDLVPDVDAVALDKRLQRDLSARDAGQFELLKAYVPRALVSVLLARSGVPRDYPRNQFTVEHRRRVGALLKNLELGIVGTRPIGEAMVTLGGVSTREIEPRTMASRLVHGLYLAGEVVDVAGETGGFNLQIAFTMGWVAGESAAGLEGGNACALRAAGGGLTA
jgi:predicted Rossmann fold flavoprotein